MKQIQRSYNPFPYTDSNKRYHTFAYHTHHTYGGKCVKIPLDAGFTCPNIDGTKWKGGCTYCSGGSRDCNVDPNQSLEIQYATVRQNLSTKWDVSRCIPYLQAHTNTYAPLSHLRSVYETAAALPDAVALCIGTRADCITAESAALLAEISQTIPVIVELGMQTVHDSTAERINRCHTFKDFTDGLSILRNAGGSISVGIHLINGLPGETHDMMLETAYKTAALRPDQIKIHLLHVLRDTPLANDFLAGIYTPLTMNAYISVVCDQLELLPAQTVITRLTGDGTASDLIAPTWSRQKRVVLNRIDQELHNRDSYQGKLLERENRERRRTRLF